MPEEYVAEAVVAMLKDRVAGQRVLLARAAVARDVIPEQLRKCGADIHVVEVYRTVIPADSIEQVRDLVWRRGAAARCGDLYQLLNGDQFFCATRGRKGRAAAGIECGLDWPGHDAHVTPTWLGAGMRSGEIRYSRSSRSLCKADHRPFHQLVCKQL